MWTSSISTPCTILQSCAGWRRRPRARVVRPNLSIAMNEPYMHYSTPPRGESNVENNIGQDICIGVFNRKVASQPSAKTTRVNAWEFQNLSMFLYYRLIHWVAYPETIRYGKSDQGLHSPQKNSGGHRFCHCLLLLMLFIICHEHSKA